ncbi:MAG: class I SAM-dependent methyltransferase [Spirochaetales bacterium]|nr:MAG: class I SAM-dependent methyltransferase [Spirochaetales bacterium]
MIPLAESAPACPLCESLSAFYHQDLRRTYYQCSHCALVFVLPGEFLTPLQERAEYELHRDAPGDQGYRKFLSRMSEQIDIRVPPESHGLDFGCGPGPALSVVFEELGHAMAIYDPFFAPDRSVLDRTYDFVTATEVAEHLKDIRADLTLMWRCVRPGGYLGIMTKRVIDLAAFARWHYKDDRTHICFYSTRTFSWLAEQWGTRPEFEGVDVVVFRKAT